MFSILFILIHIPRLSPPRREAAKTRHNFHIHTTLSPLITDKKEKVLSPHFIGIRCSVRAVWLSTRLLHNKHSPHHTCVRPSMCRASTAGHNEGAIPHSLTTAFHSLLSFTIILQCSSACPLPF